ncbi:MAG: DUF5320 domain-containing protein [Acidobacteriota bacterium]|nr:DUF5320 domain-containing protein [Acidobacteriota bacterium]
MPGGDGTGPLGRGTNTGWGRGGCRGLERQGFGRGGGFGGGGGWRNRFWATGTPGRLRGTWNQPAHPGMEPATDTELEWLEQRSASLRAEQQQIEARVEELQPKTD